MEIKQNMRNDLFKRQELVFELEANKNPSFEDVRIKISEDLKKPEGNVDVLSVHGKFGKNVFIIKANVYDSQDDKEKSVSMRKTQKQRKAERKAAEEAKKKAEEEAKSEAKPVEEVKE